MEACTPLPEGCIRGPDVHDSHLVIQYIQRTGANALHAYLEGVNALVEIERLLRLQEKLNELRRIRRFALTQLTVLEQRNPHAVATALEMIESNRQQ